MEEKNDIMSRIAQANTKEELSGLYVELVEKYKEAVALMDAGKYVEAIPILNDILEIEDEISRLLRINIIDFGIAFFIIVSLIFIIISKNLIFGFVIIILIIIELYYMYYRKEIYFDKKFKLKKIKRIRKNVNGEYKNIKDKIVVLEKDEIDLKKERKRINNDIQYYRHELSNIKNKELSKDNSYVNEKKKGYVKK